MPKKTGAHDFFRQAANPPKPRTGRKTGLPPGFLLPFRTHYSEAARANRAPLWRRFASGNGHRQSPRPRSWIDQASVRRAPLVLRLNILSGQSNKRHTMGTIWQIAPATMSPDRISVPMFRRMAHLVGDYSNPLFGSLGDWESHLAQLDREGLRCVNDHPEPRI